MEKGGRRQKGDSFISNCVSAWGRWGRGKGDGKGDSLISNCIEKYNQ